MLIRVGKLQFICLIGGRVFNPRQQQYVVNVYLWSLSARTYITYNFTYLLHTTTITYYYSICTKAQIDTNWLRPCTSAH